MAHHHHAEHGGNGAQFEVVEYKIIDGIHQIRMNQIF